ncbi:hypothetical protein FOA43_004000 [Brettanomyces nanus]|uniref:Cytochrome b5 heme-binding domain-containing protein n=1 Tax=Eeniella nana TaxID=13502 RepID=A0A875S6N1_EENNA|nr:uncharacterized protein FOA43_004000 [Brettanomyces nanus]QPG76608.1 hypothetical protein FOA43_004000 [Brettanomyces nanus]
MAPGVPSIKIIEPKSSADPDGEESRDNFGKVKFAVPSKSSKRVGHMSFAPPLAVDRGQDRLANPSVRASPVERRRKKVALKPGHSAVDWERSKKNEDVRKIDPSSFPMRITKAQLKQHHSGKDCWISLGGKVYNITNYLDYHPGGREILVDNSGADGTMMFQRYHPWVSFEKILDACFIGFLV